MSESHSKLAIGPPNSRFGGMQTTRRRQQLGPSEFHCLRNVTLNGDAIRRIQGNVLLVAGALPAKSLSLDGDPGSYVSLAKALSGVSITDYDLLYHWAIFVAYKPDDLADDVMIISDSDDAAPPWRLVHETSGVISVLVEDGASNQASFATTNTYPASTYTTVLLYRTGSTVGLIVNGDAAVTNTGTLSATSPTKTTTEAITFGSWTGRATGSQVTYYEAAIWRRTRTSTVWRNTEYPWTGRFGDPDLVLHLRFDDGSGSTITDYSRLNHEAVTIAAGGTWNSSTARQTIAPVTGIHPLEHPSGRKWLLCDIGKNHYRIPIEGSQ